MTYGLVITILALVIAAFIPAMIAACKEFHFSKWYIYALFLFPIALVHSLLLKKPRHIIVVNMSDSSDPNERTRKAFQAVALKDQSRAVSPLLIFAVFFSKLIFGAFVGLSFFALFRTFLSDIPFLRSTCSYFAIIFSVMLGIVELCGFSRLPIFADEVTKRALIISFYSVMCSLPIFLIKELILDKCFSQQEDFFTFMCSAVSMVVFVLVVLRRQRVYYSAFARFSDYCIISMVSYAIYAAITLIMLSTDATRQFINAVAMPMQVLNLENLQNIAYIPDLSFIYSSALAHLFVEIFILLSGILCRNFKEKEVRARIEYRSAAFRMSQKRILRRHIPNIEALPINPIKG